MAAAGGSSSSDGWEETYVDFSTGAYVQLPIEVTNWGTREEYIILVKSNIF